MIPYIVSDTRQFNDIIDTISNTRDILAAVVEQATADTAITTLPQLDGVAYPRPAVHPFVWSFDPQANERARRYYFAAIKRGEISTSGGRYRRTGQFGKSWDIATQETGDSIDAVLGSNFNKATYVVGNDDGTLKQIPGHERTGWYEFQPIGEAWADDVVRIVRRDFPGEIEKRLS